MMEKRTPQTSPRTRRSFLKLSARSGLMIPLASGGLGLILSACSDDGAGQAATPTGQVATPTGQASVPSDSGEREMLSARYMTAFGFGLSFMEAMVAQEQGFFEDQGLFMEILGGQGTATALQSVLGGTTQLSRANAINTTIAIANEDAPIINIGTVRQGGQFELVSLPDSPIQSPDDLKEGLTIGIVSAGGATENLLDLMLADQGIALDSVSRPVTGVGPAGFELARNGDVDAWISVNTDRATIERDGEELVSFNIYDHVDLPSDTYNCALELVEAGDDRPARFLAGITQAIMWTSQEENWEEAIENLRVYNNEIEPEAALAEMPLLVDDWLANGEDGILRLDPDLWDRGQKSLAAIGLVDQTVEVDRLIYTAYLDEARNRI